MPGERTKRDELGPLPPTHNIWERRHGHLPGKELRQGPVGEATEGELGRRETVELAGHSAGTLVAANRRLEGPTPSPLDPGQGPTPSKVVVGRACVPQDVQRQVPAVKTENGTRSLEIAESLDVGQRE